MSQVAVAGEECGSTVDGGCGCGGIAAFAWVLREYIHQDPGMPGGYAVSNNIARWVFFFFMQHSSSNTRTSNTALTANRVHATPLANCIRPAAVEAQGRTTTNMSEHHSSLAAGSAGDEVADTASTTSSSPSEDNRIKVVCRVRPPVSRERHGAKTLANRCVAVADDRRTVTLNSKPQEKNFTFDYAAGEDSTQEELFAEVCACVGVCVCVCVFIVGGRFALVLNKTQLTLASETLQEYYYYDMI